MARKPGLSQTDIDLWETYIQNVTPLGEPEPSHGPPLDRVVPPRTLDLHGVSLQEAHRYTMAFLEAATDRSVTIVTGLSGNIKREFPRWFDQMPHLRIEERKGGGAYEIHFRRKR